MNDVRSKVLSIVQINGPILPVKISKVINQNILFTSAILSELTDRKEILLSKAKIGGSPVYYIKGQEERLKMLYEHLKDVHKKVYDLLNEKKILKDSECEPWERVALREIGDFAKQFNYNNEVFWRWHLTSEEETKQLLSPEQKTEELQENPINIKEIQENPINAENIKEEVTQLKLEEPKQKLKKQKIKVSKIKDDSRILSTINNYFNENDIKILNEKIINQNKEFNYNIEVDSTIGKIIFFCKVKIKKKISDADLSLACNEAKGRQLLFLSNGELTKKALEFIEREKEIVIFNRI